MSLSNCRRKQLGRPSIREDARGKQKESLNCDSIQETGQEQRPARMVGLIRLDSAQISMEAENGDRGLKLRQRGER